jgi:hypothetical protein
MASSSNKGDQTTKLILYRDTQRHCWARVDLASGEPIYISVARSGIIVKRSSLGLFGRKLYRSNIHRAAITARALEAQTRSRLTPDDMTSPALRAFTQAALEARSSDELASRLNNATTSASSNA